MKIKTLRKILDKFENKYGTEWNLMIGDEDHYYDFKIESNDVGLCLTFDSCEDCIINEDERNK